MGMLLLVQLCRCSLGFGREWARGFGERRFGSLVSVSHSSQPHQHSEHHHRITQLDAQAQKTRGETQIVVKLRQKLCRFVKSWLTNTRRNSQVLVLRWREI